RVVDEDVGNIHINSVIVHASFFLPLATMPPKVKQGGNIVKN
ncbi:MAG: hypothetical protein ACD_66C00109G0001, partial [uncultured bacterium]